MQITNNKTLEYIGPIWLVPTYVQCAAIRSMRTKFRTLKTEKFVCVPTYGHTDRRADRRLVRFLC